MNAITRTTSVVVLVTLGVVLTTAASGAEEERPRLLATPELLAAVRVDIRNPGTHHQQVHETMKARVDASYLDNAALSKAYYGPQAQTDFGPWIASTNIPGSNRMGDERIDDVVPKK